MLTATINGNVRYRTNFESDALGFADFHELWVLHQREPATERPVD